MGNYPKDFNRKGVFEGVGGYVWKNSEFENIILPLNPGLDLIVGQYSIKNKKKETMYGKAEISWELFMGIVVKYTQLVKPGELNKIQQNKHFKNYSINSETEHAISKFFKEHKFIYWDNPSDIDVMGKNSAFNKSCAFIRKRHNVPCLYFTEYAPVNDFSSTNTSLKDALEKPSLRENFFIDKMVFLPSDCGKLLEGILTQSPFKNGLNYTIELAQKNNETYEQ
ncbi:MAG: hypothetical protein ACP5NV_01045 [Candidatus Woesearchaeota archaeon]